MEVFLFRCAGSLLLWGCTSWGCSPAVGHGLLSADTGSGAHRLQQLGLLGSRAQAQQLWRMASQTTDGTCVSCTGGTFFTTEPPGKPQTDITLKQDHLRKS